MPFNRQHFKNHSRYIPLWHFITSFVLLAVLAMAIYLVIVAVPGERVQSFYQLGVALVLCSIFWYSRWFALRAQDRAIRAEENLRHFALTGSLLDKRLRTSQVIALRFAPDNEFPELARLAAETPLRSKDIKKAIQKWRGDYHRV